VTRLFAKLDAGSQRSIVACLADSRSLPRSRFK
jgi:hypothetical protein